MFTVAIAKKNMAKPLQIFSCSSAPKGRSKVEKPFFHSLFLVEKFYIISENLIFSVSIFSKWVGEKLIVNYEFFFNSQFLIYHSPLSIFQLKVKLPNQSFFACPLDHLLQ